MLASVLTSALAVPADSRTEGEAPTTRVAAFFDLDKTVIAKSSTLAFSRPFFQSGLINRMAVLKSAYARFLFLQSGADTNQVDRMRDHLWRGIPAPEREDVRCQGSATGT